MYYNEEHKKIVEERGDNYTYIGSYRYKEETIDGKNKKLNTIFIRVKCPYCNEEYDIAIKSFRDGAKCSNCCNFYENSFAYHIQQKLKEPLNKYWDWEKNTVNPYRIYKSTAKVKIWIKCTETDYHGSYEITPNKFHGGNRCSYCDGKKIHPKDSFAQWGIDTFGKDFLKKYWSSKNTLDPFKISKGTNVKKVWILCQNKNYHNEYGGYMITPAHFIEGNRCPYCSNRHGKVHPRDSFHALYPEKAKWWSSNNKKSPYEVTPKTSTKYKFICENCGKEFERSLANLNQKDIGVKCKECSSSELEYKTKKILTKYNIKYKGQVEYGGLLGLKGGNLSYDFYLPNYNLLIECQGKQHEQFCKGFHMTEEDFKKQLEHDRRKKEYAKEHNINLLEIWYYDIDNIEEILLETLQIKNN